MRRRGTSGAMKLRGWIFAAAVAIAPAAAAVAAQEPGPDPVVVELFTAQGCAGCPDANEVVADLADRPDVIALTFPVDYWDYLGWEDTFARPEFGQRQRAYQSAMRLRDLYTPQVVVDGRRQVAGMRREAVEAAVAEEAGRRPVPPQMRFLEAGGRVAVGTGRAPEGGAEVWLVRYQTGPETVRVSRGENRGATVRHANVVRELVRLGDWDGRARQYSLPPAGEPHLETVVLVQAQGDGSILAAGRL